MANDTDNPVGDLPSGFDVGEVESIEFIPPRKERISRTSKIIGALAKFNRLKKRP